MLSSVDVSGCVPVLMAAFSAGRPKASQPNGMQHVVAAHPLRARHDVADDVVADVADVRVPGRVREHLQAVELRPRRIDLHLERRLDVQCPATSSSCCGLYSVIRSQFYWSDMEGSMSSELPSIDSPQAPFADRLIEVLNNGALFLDDLGRASHGAVRHDA